MKTNNKHFKTISSYDPIMSNKNVFLRSGDRQSYKTYPDKQDPFWYAKDENMVRNMASFPWSEVVGDSLLPDAPSIPASSADSVPGAMIINWRPSFGRFLNNDADASPTRSANMFFNYYTQGFTASVPYEAPDIFMAVAAGASVFDAMLSIKRVMGLMHYYLQLNQYYGKHMVEALGFDFEDFQRNLANARTQYNIRVAQINKLIATPHKFTISDRWNFLNSYVFTDTESSDYSTAMIFRQQCYLKYDPISLTTGSSLRWIFPFNSGSKLTVDDAFAVVDELLAALDDSDVRSMYGALRRVYDDSTFKHLTELTADYVTPIVRNDIVSAQIHNMNWFPDRGDLGSVKAIVEPAITTSGTRLTDVVLFQSSDGKILSNPVYEIAQNTEESDFAINYFDAIASEDHHLIDLYDHQLNPGNVLDITATKTVVDKSNSTSTAYYKQWGINPRCEIYTAIFITTFGASGNLAVTQVVPYIVQGATSVGSGLNTTLWTMIRRASHIDSHPLIATCVAYKNGAVVTTEPIAPGEDVYLVRSGYLGEIDRYTFVDTRTMKMLHKRCMWELLKLPENVKATT